MKDDLHSRGDSSYERPGMPWICGHSADGEPCPLGPSRLGVCGATSDCEPQLIEDRWVCNRPSHRGGPCATGPSPQGTCSRCFTKCAPVRSLRARRGWFTFCCTALTIGILAILLNVGWHAEVLAPGRLTASHEQILDGPEYQGRCKNCHAAADENVLTWLLTTCSGGQCVGTPQSTLCMKCHEQTIDVQHALQAHSLSPEVLTAVRTSRGIDEARGKQRGFQPLACATCHQEHHGSNHELTAMTDAQCQVCHAQEFRDLAHGHPEFKNWPRRRPAAIHFDHEAHGSQHFPRQQTEFVCGTCHTRDRLGEINSAVDYQQACASCHDKPLTDRDADGFVFLQLPMIDDLALEDAGINVGEWPEYCTGDFDGALPPLMRLLLMADGRARQALEQGGPNFEFGDLDPDNPEHLQMAADLVWAIKFLLYDLGSRGQTAVGERLAWVLGRDVSPAEVGKLSAQLPADLLFDLTVAWLPKLHQEIQLREIGQWPPLAERASYELGSAEILTDSRPGDAGLDEGVRKWPVNPLRTARRPLEEAGSSSPPVTSDPSRSQPLLSEPRRMDSLPPEVGMRLPLIPPGLTTRTAEVAAGHDGQAENPQAKLAQTPDDVFDRASLGRPAERVKGGGWFRDDEVFALCYRGTGHADVFYQAWHDATALAQHAENVAFDPNMVQDLGDCRSCHHIDHEAHAGESIWSELRVARFKGLTHFSHQPHLTQPRLRDCQSCHVLAEGSSGAGTSLDPSLTSAVSDFCGITKQACIGCHATSASGGGCTTCHNYHARESSIFESMRSAARATVVR